MVKKSLLIMAYLVGASYGLLPTTLFAEAMGQAKVLDIRGEAKFMKPGSSEWAILEKSTILMEGASIKTAKESKVTLELSTAVKTGEVLVREESQFTLQTLRHDESKKTDNTLLDVEIGSVLVKAEKLSGDSKFEVKTPTSIAGVRGTIFEVQVSKE